MGIRGGIDLGGTKIQAVVVDDGGDVLGSSRMPTPTTGGPPDVAETMAEAIRDAAKQADADTGDLEGVGVGSPGAVADDEGTVAAARNLPDWEEAYPLRDDLSSRLDTRVRLGNDVQVATDAEFELGAAQQYSSILGVFWGTGVGGGIVLDGRLLDGESGNAGHIGHVIVEPGGHECGCGARGCLEAEASGSAIARITGAPARDASAEVRERTGMLVGRAVASVANLLDLPLAVVAGSVALGFGEPFFAAAQRELDASCRLDFSRGTRIVPAALGADGPLIGAARVALQHSP